MTKVGLSLMEKGLTVANDKTRVVRQESRKKRAARIELENGVSVSIDEDSLPLRIGRDSNSDICLPFSHISRHHCEIYLLGGTLCIKDTSTNGTRIDNRTIREESVSLRKTTRVLLANETRLTISPCIGTEINGDDLWRPERREGERRSYQRRQVAVPVEVDRRQVERRFGERRGISQF